MSKKLKDDQKSGSVAARRKFLTGAAVATTGAAITGFPMISVAQSPI